MMKSVIAALAAPLLLASCSDPAPKPAADEASPIVFAAASLTDVLQTVGDLYAAEGHPEPRFSFAGSSALAKQLEQGAEADIFISADEAWMDYAAEKSLIDPATRVTLLTNELVLVAPAGAPIKLDLAKGMDLAGALGGGKLALADPGSVPAGKYAREALAHLGAWDAVASDVARAENVRSALRFVETGDAAAGVVYATDAAAAGGALQVVGVFPPESHTPITYPAALLAEKSDGPGTAFLDFLVSDVARKAFADAGFGLAR
jgi:molybdate transport system substrate-binding protein